MAHHRKIRPTDVNIGQLRRVFTCCTIDDDDSHLYAGTVTGDVLQINLMRCLPMTMRRLTMWRLTMR